MICPHCKYKIPDGLENCSVCGKPIMGNEKEPENEDIRFSLGARNRLKDYYQILGLEHNCTESEIKIAYKKLAIKFHPDKNQGDKFFLEMFKDVQEAYDVLSDPAKRNAYNAKLEAQMPYERPVYRQPTYSEPSRPHYETPQKQTFGDGCLNAIMGRFIGIGIVCVIGFIINIFSDCSGCSSGSSRSKYKSNKTYEPTVYRYGIPSSTSTSKDDLNKIIETPKSQFAGNQLKTGDSPYDSYFGKSIYNKNYHNQLELINGENGDVIVCLIEYAKKKRTIRNEYIRAGETFTMTNIPNGTYIIKTFSGKDWNPDKIMFNGKIKGGFDTDIGFSISDREKDLLVMNQREEENGIKYSAHTITLYKVKDGNMESRNINDMDFFNEEF